MDEILKIFATVQNGGGLLAVLVYMALSIKQLGERIVLHEKIFHGGKK